MSSSSGRKAFQLHPIWDTHDDHVRERSAAMHFSCKLAPDGTGASRSRKLCRMCCTHKSGGSAREVAVGSVCGAPGSSKNVVSWETCRRSDLQMLSKLLLTEDQEDIFLILG
eukprot:5234173-Amphidinium_carterae.2